MKPLAVITGTTHGIGRITARELARAGLHVVMLCRDLASAEAVRDDIVTGVPGSTVDALHCDLANLHSVGSCVHRLRRHFGRIRLLVNNAGTVVMRHRLSADGFELTFATNHLGPFLLTGLLLNRMEPRSRIVMVASRVHYKARLNLHAITDAQARYSPTAAYAQSKLANVMHTFALARRLQGTGISVNCLHPGVVASNLLPRWVQLIKPLVSPLIFDEERGARTTLQLALSKDVSGMTGLYFDEHGQPQPASALANDETLQELLWSMSTRWVAATAVQERATG